MAFGDAVERLSGLDNIGASGLASSLGSFLPGAEGRTLSGQAKFVSDANHHIVFPVVQANQLFVGDAIAPGDPPERFARFHRVCRLGGNKVVARSGNENPRG